MPEISREIEAELRPHMRVFYDDSGAWVEDTGDRMK